MSDDLSIPNPGYRGNQAGRYGTGQGRSRRGMDPDTRRLMIFAGGLGAVLASLIGASMLIGHRSTEVPVIAADTRPLRIKPADPGGMKIDGAENDVFSGDTDTANSKLAAVAENPDMKALHTGEAPPPPVVEAPLAAVAILPPPVIKPPAASAPSVAKSAVAASQAVVTKPAIAASALTATKPVVVASQAPVTKSAIAAGSPAATKPVAVASSPSATRLATDANAPAATKLSVGGNPAALGPTPAAAEEAHPPAAGHLAMVQLAALTSEDAAHNEWQRLSKRMPELLNGRKPVFTRTDRDGQTFWRVRAAGFADVAEARTFCDQIRAKGGGCSVADF